MHIIRTLLALALAIGTANATTGCQGADAQAGEVLGPHTPPEGYAATTVQQLAEDDRLKDQNVLFTGTVNKVGCAGCGGVIVADKTWRISCEPADPSKFKIPVRIGKAIKVWGVLRVTDDGFREVKAERVEFIDRATKS